MKTYFFLSCMILGSMALPAPPAEQPAPFDPSRVKIGMHVTFETTNDRSVWKEYISKNPICDSHRTYVKEGVTREDCAKGNQRMASVGFQYHVEAYNAANLQEKLQQNLAPCISQLIGNPAHKGMPKTAKGTCYQVDVYIRSPPPRVRPQSSEQGGMPNEQPPPATSEESLRPYRKHYKSNPDCRPLVTTVTAHICADRNRRGMVTTGFTYQNRCRSPYDKDIPPDAQGLCHQRTAKDIFQNPPSLVPKRKRGAQQDRGTQQNLGAQQNLGHQQNLGTQQNRGAQQNRSAGQNSASPRHRASTNPALANILN